MADQGPNRAETLRLYDKACLAWSQASDSEIKSWRFEREGREGEYKTIERDEVTEFIKQLVKESGLESPGDPDTPGYWPKARAIIAAELEKIGSSSEETEFQVAQPDEETLKTLETLAQDQASRRNIPIGQARELVWKTLKLQSKVVVNEAAGSQAGSLPESLAIKQAQQTATESKPSSPNQQYLDQEMNHIVERADSRPYSLRREPDKLLFQAIKSLLAQITRKVDGNQASRQVVVLADEQTSVPDYSQPLNSPDQVRSLRQGSGLGRRIVGEVAQRLTKKGLESAAKNLGWTALETGTKAVTTAGATVAKGALATGAKGLLAAILGGPPGWIFGAATLLKGVLDLFGKGGIGNFFKRLFSGAVSQGQISARKGMDAVGMGGLVGGILGAIIGAGGGPLGLIGMGIIGMFMGKTGGSFLGNFLSGNISLGGSGSGAKGSSRQNKKGGLVFLGGTAVAAGGAWVVIILVILFIIFFLFHNRKEEDQVAQIPFTVSVTADPTKVSGPDFEARSREITIKYTINIVAKGNDLDLKATKITIKGVNNKGEAFLPLATQNLPISKSTLSSSESALLAYDFNIPGPFNPTAFDDSKIYAVVDVTGQVKDEPEETKTATALTVIGNPPFNQPYGYPAIGYIESLDIEPAYCLVTLNDGKDTVIKQDPQKDADGRAYCVKPAGVKKVKLSTHAGTPLRVPFEPDFCRKTPISPFWEINRCRLVSGGLDIAMGGGNVPVYSTMDGTVIKSVFDWGPTNIRGSDQSCIPNKAFNRFCYPGLGGVVYIQSDDKKYIVAYLHLAEEGLIAEGAKVTRGQQIGKTYPSRICEQTKGLPDLCTSSGAHVHYQIFIDGMTTNVDFNDVNVVGSCLDGKILPSGSNPDKPQPILGQYVTEAVTECK